MVQRERSQAYLSYSESRQGTTEGQIAAQTLATVINSDTYQRLQRDATGLYHQSSRYVYSFLDSELKTGRVK